MATENGISMSARSCNIRYAFINGAMYAAGLCYNGFATTYLLDVGFTTAKVGILFAAGNFGSILMQSLFSTLADKSRKITLTMIQASQIILTMILLAAMLHETRASLITACAFILITSTYATKQSLANGIGLWYIAHGVKLNYGVPRGIGSVSYALMSLFVGEVASRIGCWIIPLFAIVMEALFLTAIFLMPTKSREEDEKRESGNRTGDTQKAGSSGNQTNENDGLGFFEFCNQNRSFTILIAGMILIGIAINNLGVYGINIVESLGGDASNYGILSCISAMSEFPAMAAYKTLEKKFSCRSVFMLAIVGYFFKACGYALAPNLYLLYGASALQMISYALFMPASLSFVKLYIRKQDSNKAVGLLTSYFFAGGIIGSPIGGFVLNRFGIRILEGSSVALAAIGVVTALTGVIGTTRGKKESAA